ncbi:MAG: hypothetical protein ACNA7O_08670 [Rhodobacterales bacterium]
MSSDQKTKFERYVEEIGEDITETVKSMGCQPILFVGSGLSRRYMNAPNPVLNDVNPRILRSLIARSYNLVRHDIPTMTVEADFKMLDQAVTDSDSFAKLFGIANISDYSAASAHYPLSATQLTTHLGGTGSYLAVSLLKRIKDETGVDIKASDNRYHKAEQVNTSTFHKYSTEMLEVLKKVRAGEPYELNMG